MQLLLLLRLLLLRARANAPDQIQVSQRAHNALAHNHTL